MAGVAPFSTVLIGRKAEDAALREVIDAARAGRRGLAVVAVVPTLKSLIEVTGTSSRLVASAIATTLGLLLQTPPSTSRTPRSE